MCLAISNVVTRMILWSMLAVLGKIHRMQLKSLIDFWYLIFWQAESGRNNSGAWYLLYISMKKSSLNLYK